MTESEAREIVEKYEALVIAAARDTTFADWGDASLLKRHRLTVRGGQLELQSISTWLDYDAICYDFEPALMPTAYPWTND